MRAKGGVAETVQRSGQLGSPAEEPVSVRVEIDLTRHGLGGLDARLKRVEDVQPDDTEEKKSPGYGRPEEKPGSGGKADRKKVAFRKEGDSVATRDAVVGKVEAYVGC